MVEHLETRTNKMLSIHIEEIDKYMNELANGRYLGDLKNNWAFVHNRINKKMYQNNCGISQVEEQVHQVRLDIQTYLKKYDPIK